MTSLGTSIGHKAGQNLELLYLHQYFSYSVDQKLKISEMLMDILLVYSASGITTGKKSLSRPQNGGHHEKNWNMKRSFIFTSDMKLSSKIMRKKVFSWW